MKDDFYIGSVTNTLVYCVEVIITIVVGAVMQKFSLPVQVMIDVYLLLSIVVSRIYLKRSAKAEVYYGYCHSVLLVVISVIACLEYSNGYMLYFLLFFQMISILTYMNQKLCRFHAGISLGTAMIVCLFGKMILEKTPTAIEHITALIALGAGQWFIINIAKLVKIRDRQNFEQERSLDDLLKVVEAKCDEARQATKSKSDFLSNMSHEIRTPLNAILGMNEMILRENKNERVQDYAANVESSGKMLLSLINDILDFSKIESGRMEIIEVNYQVSSVLNDVVNMIKPRAEQKGLLFDVEVSPQIPNSLSGDEVRIRQILTNLLTNAVKYTDKGKVLLSVAYETVYENNIRLIIRVKDTGRGIKKEDQAKLFKVFQRVDEKHNRNIEGTGLGLSITARFVEMMDGEIGVNSVYGEGSEFYVYLPQRVVQNDAMGDFKKRLIESNRKREKSKESFCAPDAKVLVIDDNEMNLKIAKELLRRTKVQVDLCTGGKEALLAVCKKQYDVILLDHMMPEMDGIETLKRMKETAENLSIKAPVIALTANAISGVREMYLREGFDDYLSKPVGGEQLEEILLKYIDKNKLLNPTANEEYLDTALGLSYCGGETEIYQDVLQMFCDLREEKTRELERCLMEGDWSNYTIQIHALKSSGLSIGGRVVSKLAEELEMAGKRIQAGEESEANIAFIQEKHATAMDAYVKTVTKGKQYIDRECKE